MDPRLLLPAAVLAGVTLLSRSRLLRAFLLSAAGGMAAVVLLWGLGCAAPAPLLPMSPLSLGTGFTLGLPGVIGLLLFQVMAL